MAYWGHSKLNLTINTKQVKWLCFLGETKPEYPGKTSRCREENPQTQPKYDA